MFNVFDGKEKPDPAAHEEQNAAEKEEQPVTGSVSESEEHPATDSSAPNAGTAAENKATAGQDGKKAAQSTEDEFFNFDPDNGKKKKKSFWNKKTYTKEDYGDEPVTGFKMVMLALKSRWVPILVVSLIVFVGCCAYFYWRSLDNAEAMLKYVIKYVLENAPEEMEFFGSVVDKELMPKLENVIKSEFGRISYTEAIKILQESGEKFEYPVEWGHDLQTEHERYLAEKVYQKPVFVTDYPMEIKSFYMKQNPDGKTVAAADLLVPGVGELIGGSQREENYDKLVKRMDDLGMDKTEYWWYLELRKFGGVEHAGYGLGFERLLMYITGMGNIRDVIPFPRTVGTAEF